MKDNLKYKENQITKEKSMSVTASLFIEIEKHLLQDEKPSQHLQQLLDQGALEEYPLTMLSRMQQTEQSPKYHAEGNVWIHTMMVLDEAAAVKSQSSDARVFMWAALLHDIGKPDTTKLRHGRITAYDHDRVGTALAREFLQYYDCDTDFIEKVVDLVRWHMQILYVVKDLPFAQTKAMQKHGHIEEIALLGKCDRLGRLGVQREVEENNIAEFLRKVQDSD